MTTYVRSVRAVSADLRGQEENRQAPDPEPFPSEHPVSTDFL
jgi:hypothetical protein